MKPLETRQRFREQLTELRLDPDHLDPWAGWRAFKEFLKQEVEGPYDAASVQVQPEDDATSMFFVRQFSQREGRSSDGDDVLLGRLSSSFSMTRARFLSRRYGLSTTPLSKNGLRWLKASPGSRC